MAVPLGAASYEIRIGHGILTDLPATLEATCSAARYAVIADSSVAERFGGHVTDAVRAVAPCELFPFPAGEWNKTAAEWAELNERLLASGLGRDGAIIALGGGVTGDLAGFVAATFMRGIPYVQVPTTLLAMIDSSIGGKTGIDTAHGKNLVGAFHQPRAVLADVATLRDLPPVHLAAGMAEALKHGAIADAAYFQWLLGAWPGIKDRDPDALIPTVTRSVEIKAGVVAADEREEGMRAILNFGHTVAHAIEATSGYEVLHGEAVAIGMTVEARLGVRLGITDPGAHAGIQDALMAFGLPVEPPDKPAHDLLAAMRRDKKARDATVRFALIKALGEAARGNAETWTFEAPEHEIIAALEG